MQRTYNEQGVKVNTVLESPPDGWMFCIARDNPMKERTVSVNPVAIYHCISKRFDLWEATYMGKCHAVFDSNGHFLANETYASQANS